MNGTVNWDTFYIRGIPVYFICKVIYEKAICSVKNILADKFDLQLVNSRHYKI